MSDNVFDEYETATTTNNNDFFFSPFTLQLLRLSMCFFVNLSPELLTEFIFSKNVNTELTIQMNIYLNNKHNSSPWIWKGVSATSQSGRYTLSYPRWRIMLRK